MTIRNKPSDAGMDDVFCPAGRFAKAFPPLL